MCEINKHSQETVAERFQLPWQRHCYWNNVKTSSGRKQPINVLTHFYDRPWKQTGQIWLNQEGQTDLQVSDQLVTFIQVNRYIYGDIDLRPDHPARHGPFN